MIFFFPSKTEDLSAVSMVVVMASNGYVHPVCLNKFSFYEAQPLAVRDLVSYLSFPPLPKETTPSSIPQVNLPTDVLAVCLLPRQTGFLPITWRTDVGTMAIKKEFTCFHATRLVAWASATIAHTTC